MNIDAKQIKKIYESKVARKYDKSMSHFFAGFKKKAFENSSITKGDSVLVFCCGTGLDLPHILDKIGPSGSILGVDFSLEMLKKAEAKIKKYQWENVELVQADVTKYEPSSDVKADVGVCTLGMSIIPDYEKAYQNLLSGVKNGGEIIIGDMQLASGWKERFNPFTIFLAKRFGGTEQGHRNSLKLISMMYQDLQNVKKHEFFMGAYYYCLGNKKPKK